MSDARGKKIPAIGGNTVIDARSDAIKAAIEARLAEFDQQKGKLLEILRRAHNRGQSKSEKYVRLLMGRDTSRSLKK